MKKREIWLSQNACGSKNGKRQWEECSRHYSKYSAQKAARACENSSGIRHKVTKQVKVSV